MTLLMRDSSESCSCVRAGGAAAKSAAARSETTVMSEAERARIFTADSLGIGAVAGQFTEFAALAPSLSNGMFKIGYSRQSL